MLLHTEKYDLVGKLLRKGEQATNYEDEEEDTDKDIKPNDTALESTPNIITDENLKSGSNDDEGVRKRPATTSTTEEVK